MKNGKEFDNRTKGAIVKKKQSIVEDINTCKGLDHLSKDELIEVKETIEKLASILSQIIKDELIHQAKQ